PGRSGAALRFASRLTSGDHMDPETELMEALRDPATPPGRNGPSSSEVRSTNQSELGVADQRRLDVDAKQELVARLLHDTGCEGLLVLHPANFRWLTSGATPAGLAGRD